MDIAKSLVRCIVRAFYDVRHVLVIDALMIHNAVRDDDLAHLLGLQTKDLHKLCGKLKEDRLLSVQTRLESKDGQQRPVNRTYYYVDFRATVDAVKYRMYAVTKDVEKAMNKDADTKGFVCPRCTKQFSMLDAMAVMSDTTGLFHCDRCSTELVNDDDSADATASQERLGRFSDQTKKIVTLLRQIDEVVVPPTSFEDAFRNAIPVTREKSHFTTTMPDAASGRPQAVSGMKNGIAALEVSITSTGEKSAAELAAEQAKKLAQQNQNALPEWYTKSTVTGEITTAGMKEAAERREREKHLVNFQAGESEEKKPEDEAEKGVQVDAIAQYYAALKAKEEAEAKAEQEEEEDDEDEEDEDEEFEEVEVSAPASVGPVTSAMATPVNGSSKGDDSDTTATPGGERPAKRVKIQSPAEPEGDGEDSEEDVDFEDV